MPRMSEERTRNRYEERSRKRSDVAQDQNGRKEAVLLRKPCLVTSTVKGQMTGKNHCIWHVTLVTYGE